MTRFLAVYGVTVVLALTAGLAFAQGRPGPGPGNNGGDIDAQLRALIDDHNIDGDPVGNLEVPSIRDPLTRLGKQLFFSKALGGGLDSACVSCHHPMLGGADALSLSVGVAAVEPDLLGPGREHITGLPPVPRNAPTVFNSLLFRDSLFWDSRVEVLGRRGNGGIRTPDSAFGEADADAGPDLLTAQARFPVTSAEEMKTEEFLPEGSRDEIRDHLASRLGGYGAGEGELSRNRWLGAFRSAFESSAGAEELITYASIATALARYEASMVFVDNPWNRYVAGDDSALSEQQKQGARLFLSSARDGGAGCVNCHSGDLFSDEEHHNVAFPQFGPGKGDGADGAADFGRERESGDDDDRFAFRTPSLLNVAVTAPYGHAGAYDTLEEVVRHYDNPRNAVQRFFRGGAACTLDQFEDMQGCEDFYPSARLYSTEALNELEDDQDAGESELQNFNLNNNEVDALVAFLEALTDPCVTDRDCLSPWIANNGRSGPDNHRVIAVDAEGNLL